LASLVHPKAGGQIKTPARRVNQAHHKRNTCKRGERSGALYFLRSFLHTKPHRFRKYHSHPNRVTKAKKNGHVSQKVRFTSVWTTRLSV